LKMLRMMMIATKVFSMPHPSVLWVSFENAADIDSIGDCVSYLIDMSHTHKYQH
jgi:hypothetical protein